MKLGQKRLVLILFTTRDLLGLSAPHLAVWPVPFWPTVQLPRARDLCLMDKHLALVMICVGGMGHNIGAVIGAAIMTTLPYLVQGVAGYVLLLQAIVLFFVLRFLPGGVVGAVQKILSRRLQHRMKTGNL